MNGLTHIYTGDGKGKTTAALGLAVRAAGREKRVLILQFFKGSDCGELHTLARIPNITVLRLDGDYGFYKFMDDAQRAAVREQHNAMLNTACEKAFAGQCDLLILDEVISAYTCRALDTDRVDELVRNKPAALELVLTGRNAPESFVEAADYVTEMRKIKHPYDRKIASRKGIEY